MGWYRRRIRLRRPDPELAARIAEWNQRERQGRRRFAPMCAALAAGAVGDEAGRVAVEMLTCYPHWRPFWLAYEGFADRFVHVCGQPNEHGVRPARLAWEEAIAALDAGDLPAPVGQQRRLRLAASMAAGVPVSLRDCLIPGLPGSIFFI